MTEICFEHVTKDKNNSNLSILKKFCQCRENHFTNIYDFEKKRLFKQENLAFLHVCFICTFE